MAWAMSVIFRYRTRQPLKVKWREAPPYVPSPAVIKPPDGFPHARHL